MDTIRKIGIFSWYGYRTPIKHRLQKIKEAGFDATMLWWGDPLAFEELDKTQLVKETRKQKLIIENIHVPFDDANAIWSSDRQTGKNMIARYLSWIMDCAQYQIPVMVMHISRGTEIKEPNRLGKEAIETVVEAAEKYNVRIALENTRNNHLLEYLLSSNQSKHVGICYDTSHAQLYGDEKFHLMEKYGNRIFCFHLSDNDGEGDRHWLIGHGIIDWNAFVEKFPSDYSGIVSAEVYPEGEKIDELEFLRNAYAGVHNLIKGLDV